MLDLLELSGGIATAHHGTDGGSGDDVGINPMGVEFEQDADMRPAARGARAKRDTDLRPAARRCKAGYPARWFAPRR